jgi:hypothetical protein
MRAERHPRVAHRQKQPVAIRQRAGAVPAARRARAPTPRRSRSESDEAAAGRVTGDELELASASSSRTITLVSSVWPTCSEIVHARSSRPTATAMRRLKSYSCVARALFARNVLDLAARARVRAVR